MNHELLPEDIHSSDPETQHAVQQTLEDLLVAVELRAGEDHNGFQRADIDAPFGSSLGTTTLRSFEIGFHPDNQNLLAQITTREDVGKHNNRLITNYLVFQAPDGLEIKGYSTTDIKDTSILDPDLTKPHARIAYSEENRRRKELRKDTIIARSEEDELGLSFVSEQQATDLLDFVKQLAH